MNRRPGEAVSVILGLSTGVRSGWCGSSYAGPLTLDLAGLPAGAEATFSPSTLPAASSWANREATASLRLPPEVPDGLHPLRFSAREATVTAPACQLVLGTRP